MPGSLQLASPYKPVLSLQKSWNHGWLTLKSIWRISLRPLSLQSPFLHFWCPPQSWDVFAASRKLLEGEETGQGETFRLLIRLHVQNEEVVWGGEFCISGTHATFWEITSNFFCFAVFCFICFVFVAPVLKPRCHSARQGFLSAYLSVLSACFSVCLSFCSSHSVPFRTIIFRYHLKTSVYREWGGHTGLCSEITPGSAFRIYSCLGGPNGMLRSKPGLATCQPLFFCSIELIF